MHWYKHIHKTIVGARWEKWVIFSQISFQFNLLQKISYNIDNCEDGREDFQAQGDPPAAWKKHKS